MIKKFFLNFIYVYYHIQYYLSTIFYYKAFSF
nr:MAG TPA: hypothetical protein [Caudoviricetes sp.]